MTNTLYVKAYVQDVYDPANSAIASYVNFIASSYTMQPSNQVIIQYGTQNTSATPFPLFPSAAVAIAYYKDAQATLLMNAINTAIGTTYYTAYDVETVDAPIGAAIATLQGEITAVEAEIPTITTGAHIANASTAAQTTLPTTQNVLTTLLGTLVSSSNTTNAEVNAIGAQVVDLSSKFNTLLGILQTNNILATS